MKNLAYYKANNKEPYQTKNYETEIELGATEALQLKCIQCAGSYTDAYKCKNKYCPLILIKNKKMKRPHTASSVFLEKRININDIK